MLSRVIHRLGPRLLVLGLFALLQATASGQNWPAPTPPGQPPARASAAVDAAPPAPTLSRDLAWRTSQAAIGRVVTAHTLLNRQGQPVRLADYRGKPLLVSFIYTGCFQVCPLSTRTLQMSLQALRSVVDADRFNVVSIGFNQPADSPQALRAFAAQHRITESNWDFLSPPPATVDALTRDFGFSALATPAGFDHVIGLSVVDGQGRIVAQLYGDRLTAEQIAEPLRRLLRGAPVPPPSALDRLIERVRIICTVYDPETGTYRTQYGLILELAGGVGFLLAMGVFFVHEARQRKRGPHA